jgi:hypothetical protein
LAESLATGEKEQDQYKGVLQNGFGITCADILNMIGFHEILL